MNMVKIDENEFAGYYKTYMQAVKHPSKDLIENLELSLQEGLAFLESIPSEKHAYSYQENKWSVKEVLQHLIDTERVFGFRALHFSRKDPNALPGFDQDEYLQNANVANRNFKDLLLEFSNLRMATISLFRSFNSDSLKRAGMASGHIMSVRAAGYIIAGHQEHHFRVIKELYL